MFLTGCCYLGYDPVATRELYCQSITFFCTASLIQALALYLMPSFNLKLTDSLPSVYFSAGLIAVILDAVTLRMGKKAQSYACLLVLLLSFYGFSQLYPVSYGNYFWSQNDCKSVKGIDFDCNRYPVQHVINDADGNNDGKNEEQEQGSKERRISTVYVDMPGKAEPYRYHVGHEMQADHHIASIQYASFSKAYQEATGTERYHRIQSTPGPSESEVAGWQKEIFAQARQRAKQRKALLAEQEEKKRQEKEEAEEEQEQTVDQDIKDEHQEGDTFEQEEQEKDEEA